MAAQDLQIQPRRSGYLAQQQSLSAQTQLSREAETDGQSILASALKRRWWLFLIIAGISAFVGKEVMDQFGKNSTRSSAALIQTGLPTAPGGGEVIKSMAPTTCAELITSVNTLDKLCKSRGLEISPKILQTMLETTTTRGSSLLNIEFSWSDANEGAAILNDLCNIFVEEIASQRKRTLNSHMQHAERAFLQARAEVANARQKIFEVHSKQQKVLEEGGLNSERYRSMLASVSSTQVAVDEKRVELLGVNQQIEAIEQKRESLDGQTQQVLDDYKKQLAGKVARRLLRVGERLTKTSPVYQQLSALVEKVEGFPEAKNAPTDIQQWQTELYAMTTDSRLPIPTSDVQELAQIFDAHLEAFGVQLQQIETSRTQLAKQRENLELSVIPLTNQIKMLENRLLDYQKQADEVGEQLTGIGADQYGESELQLEQAESQQKSWSAQLDNLSQLEKCRVNEWSISVPASLQTTEVSSNGTKLFALAFGLCGLVLSTPVLASEWYRQQTSPQVAFANSLHLPVLAERILQDFAPRYRHRAAGNRMGSANLSEDQLEVVRMLALRIQQSSHSDGSVVLFSSIDPHYSPAPLMASIAECLAQREEKVLIVDAISPSKTGLPITNVMPRPAAEAAASGKEKVKASVTDHPGLSEYLTSGGHTGSDLARPTGCPGVDLISSGHAAFPREALASSCLTELVERCRENYTMILVNSPSATASADLQMLTARADGVVLMATKNIRKNPRARAAVADLIDLGAPIIGVVA